ncbi:LVIVD repeat-containing protein [Candidatus Leptofilum sp.]|uniref:LVIVD repeat-containing protein n=1 Tax=Candidatus Leptofilum sp. TaxID=3241576 RepID=UPI003B5AE903
MKIKQTVFALSFAFVTVTALLGQAAATKLDAKVEGSSSSPQNIEWMTQLYGDLNSQFVRGNYAYFGIGANLNIVDISDPSHPVSVGTGQMPTFVNHLFVIGSYAYFFSGETDQLHMVDVSDPGHPTYMQIISLPIVAPDTINAIQVLNETTVAVHGDSWIDYNIGYSNTSFLIDFANTPTLILAEINFPDGKFVRLPYVQGNYLYGYSYNDDLSAGLVIWDISSPASPQIVSEIEVLMICGFRNCERPFRLSVNNGIAFLSTIGGSEDNEIHLIDISDLAKPVYLGMVQDIPYKTIQFAVQDTYLFEGLHSQTDEAATAEFKVFDIANPTAPVMLSQTDLVELKRIEFVEVVGQIAFVMGESVSGRAMILLAIDITLPQSPQIIGHYTQTLGSFTFPALVREKYAFVLEDIGLTAYDLLSQHSPFPISYLPLENVIHGAPSANDYFYVLSSQNVNGTESNLLQIVDISNPNTLQIVGTVLLSSPISEISTNQIRGVNENYVFVEGLWGEFEVINVSNPAAPTTVGSYMYPFGSQSGWWTSSIAISGANLFFVGTEVNRSDIHLRVFDITNPSLPNEVGTFQWSFPADTFGYVRLFVNADTVYAAGSNELRMVDVSQPENPIEIASITASVSDMAFSDSYIVAILDSGLVIWEKVGDQLNQVGYFPAVDEPYEVHADGRDIVTHSSTYYSIFKYAVMLPITGTVLMDGGTLASPIDQTSYIIPSGTFTDTVLVSHTPLYHNIPKTNDVVVSQTFEFAAVFSGTEQIAVSQNPITVTVPYDPSRVMNLIDGTLTLCYWDGMTWQKADSLIDPLAKTITAMLPYQTIWQLQGEAHRTYLPIMPYQQK